MKMLLKIFGGLLLTVALSAACGLLYLEMAFPKVSPAADLKVESTPERLARGKYLFTNVASCIVCHSERDMGHYGMPIVDGTIGKGGEIFPHEAGIPGTLYARNITPYNLGNWTDGEIYRALTTGVNKQGKPLFPMMPYKNLAQMSREDLYSLIAYLRTLPSIKNDPPERSLDFPVNLIVRTIPSDSVQPEKAPQPSDGLAYGKYLVTSASCAACHTPRDGHGKNIPGLDFAGGFKMPLPGGAFVTTANITPDKETGIGNWTKKQFIDSIRDGAKAQTQAVKPGEFNSWMPRSQFAGMTDTDLGAIYDYLRTVPPVSHKIERFTPAPKL
jgi:mono/diheme cytochrome c family protein